MATAALPIHAATCEKFTPTPPQTLEEADLSSAAVEALILKTLHINGETLGRELVAPSD